MNASYHVVELVRQKISNEFLKASDTDVARVLGISRAVISAYKRGVVMSGETLEKAQEVLQLPPGELWELSNALLLESQTQTPAVKAAHEWMRDRAQRLIKTAARGFAVAMLAAGTLFALPSNQAHATPSFVTTDIHYAKRRRRPLRDALDRFARFLFVFPVAVLDCAQ